MFTARYALSPHIKQIRLVLKGLKISAINRWQLQYNNSPSDTTLLRTFSDKSVGAVLMNLDRISGYPEFEDRSHNRLYDWCTLILT